MSHSNLSVGLLQQLPCSFGTYRNQLHVNLIIGLWPSNNTRVGHEVILEHVPSLLLSP